LRKGTELKVLDPGDSFENSLQMYTVPPVQKVQSEKWLGNICGAFGWVFVAYFGSIWFAIHAYMGNFEGFFWFIKTLRTWVPLAIVRSSELYYNR